MKYYYCTNGLIYRGTHGNICELLSPHTGAWEPSFVYTQMTEFNPISKYVIKFFENNGGYLIAFRAY